MSESSEVLVPVRVRPVDTRVVPQEMVVAAFQGQHSTLRLLTGTDLEAFVADNVRRVVAAELLTVLRDTRAGWEMARDELVHRTAREVTREYRAEIDASVAALSSAPEDTAEDDTPNTKARLSCDVSAALHTALKARAAVIGVDLRTLVEHSLRLTLQLPDATLRVQMGVL